jgi:excisionase family DNA binding protein
MARFIKSNINAASEKLITAKRAAAFLNVTPETVRRCDRRNEIPFIRIGIRYRFKTEDLNEWIEERCISEPGPKMIMSREVARSIG